MRYTIFRRYFLTLFLLTQLPACALLIPDNPSVARYNTVVGGVRKPELNPGRSAPAAAPMAPQSALPPVDPATEAKAREMLAAGNTATVAEPAPQTPVVATDLPPATLPDAKERRVPVENQTQTMEVAQNGSYPDLSTVPPRPVSNGEESDAARLARVRAQLEAENASTRDAASKLRSDAAAQPSLLNTPEVQGIAPLPEPVVTAPQAPATPPVTQPAAPTVVPAPAPQTRLAPPAPSPAPVAMSVPTAPHHAGGSYIALPPPMPPLAARPPVTVNPVAPAAANPQLAYAAIPATPTLEPIILRAPVMDVPATPPSPSAYTLPSPAAVTEPQTLAPAAGGFNPMASGATTTMTHMSYLPSSRYAQRR